MYNDNYGHVMGDECLNLVAATLKEIPSRPTDLVARYGGEEFALVLAETTSAQTVAEECRRSIEGLQIQHGFSDTTDVVTISVGACTCSPTSGTNPRMIIDSADKALYKAKKTGRNRVEVIVLDHEVHLAFAGTDKLKPSR
jgi:diguanylate cyclase (GGDEF)-like protein